MEEIEEEDTVQYFVIPQGKEFDLTSLKEKCLTYLSDDITNYLWHKDLFSLRVSSDNSCLEGQVEYGENVEDEWFVVALLKKLSLRFPDLVIRVIDGDGEILLIETSDLLPEWAQEPELSEKRVYIFRGQMHIIPRAVEKPSEMNPLMNRNPIPDMRCAAKIVFKYPGITLASEKVQEALNKRLHGYPVEWTNQEHFLVVRLPFAAARIFQRCPQVISPAVQSVVCMDPIDAKSCQPMKHFPQEQMVRTRLKMTQCLYAMLQSKAVWPAKKSKWKLPDKSDSNNFIESQNGFKLTCGLEILLGSAKKKNRGSIGESSVISNSYEKKLQTFGYFKGNMKGSKEYQELLKKAHDYLQLTNNIENETFLNNSKSLCVSLYNEEDQHFDPKEWDGETLLESSSDEWIQIDEEKLEKMLMETFKQEQKHSSKSENSEMIVNLNKFLQKSSDMKGVEDEENDHDFESGDEIDFKSEDFGNVLESMLQHLNDEENEEEEEEEFEKYFEEMDLNLRESLVYDPSLGAENVIDNLRVESNERVLGPSTILMNSALK